MKGICRFIALLILTLCVCPLLYAQSAESSPTTLPGPKISSPPGLVSVMVSSKAKARFTTKQTKPELSLLDAFLSPSDIDLINHDNGPNQHYLVEIFQAKDPTFRFTSPEMFAAIVADQRKRFLNAEAVKEGNESMKEGGIDSSITEVHGDRLLVDDKNCFAKLVVGKYAIDGETNLPPLSMMLAYVYVRGQLVIVYAYAKGESPSDEAWLANDVTKWLRSLPAAS